MRGLFQPPVSREQMAGTAQWCSLQLPIEGTSSIPTQAPIQHWCRGGPRQAQPPEALGPEVQSRTTCPSGEQLGSASW